MRARRGAVTGATAASALAHLLLLALVTRVEVPAKPPSPGTESQLVELTLSPIESPAQADALVESLDAAPRRLERPHPPRAPGRPSQPIPEPAAATATPPVPVAPTQTDEAPGGLDPRALAAALQPRAVALAGAAPSCAPVERTCAVPDEPPVPARANPADTLQSSLEHAARAVPHLKPRPGPELKRRADGSHEYDGHVFHARIRPDGHVEFEDRAGGIAGTPLAFSFDLTDMVEKHLLGKELYTSEKHWFLEHTRELRRRLERQHLAEQRAGGLRRLRGRLMTIVEADGVPAAQRRLAVFELWNDCSDDEVGSEAQRVIEAFIRERMPRHSPLGYGDAELAALDRRRAGARRFAPYG